MRLKNWHINPSSVIRWTVANETTRTFEAKWSCLNISILIAEREICVTNDCTSTSWSTSGVFKFRLHRAVNPIIRWSCWTPKLSRMQCKQICHPEFLIKSWERSWSSWNYSKKSYHLSEPSLCPPVASSEQRLGPLCAFSVHKLSRIPLMLYYTIGNQI